MHQPVLPSSLACSCSSVSVQLVRSAFASAATPSGSCVACTPNLAPQMALSLRLSEVIAALASSMCAKSTKPSTKKAPSPRLLRPQSRFPLRSTVATSVLARRHPASTHASTGPRALPASSRELTLPATSSVSGSSSNAAMVPPPLSTASPSAFMPLLAMAFWRQSKRTSVRLDSSASPKACAPSSPSLLSRTLRLVSDVFLTSASASARHASVPSSLFCRLSARRWREIVRSQESRMPSASLRPRLE
mmetsp:Transcript_30870/g.80566  ORF Transcript_30870/g.80566 Transcript_30870/m.80566 type:complete len:248 (-) Transcript_30870:1827-2570(-)